MGKDLKEKVIAVYVGRHAGQEGYWVGVEKPSASSSNPDGWSMNRSGGTDYICAKLAEDIFPELPGEGQWIETRNTNEVEEPERVVETKFYNLVSGAIGFEVPVGPKHPATHNLEAWMPLCSWFVTNRGRTWRAGCEANDGWDIEAD